MRWTKLLNDFDMGPFIAQPAPTLQIWTTFDNVDGSCWRHKGQTLFSFQNLEQIYVLDPSILNI